MKILQARNEKKKEIYRDRYSCGKANLDHLDWREIMMRDYIHDR